MFTRQVILPDGAPANGVVMKFTTALCSPINRSSDFAFMFLVCSSAFPAVTQVTVEGDFVIHQVNVHSVLFAQMMLAAAEDFPGYRSRRLGRNDLKLVPITTLVHFAPETEDSNGTTATLVFENVSSQSQLCGWTVEPLFSSHTEVH